MFFSALKGNESIYQERNVCDILMGANITPVHTPCVLDSHVVLPAHHSSQPHSLILLYIEYKIDGDARSGFTWLKI